MSKHVMDDFMSMTRVNGNDRDVVCVGSFHHYPSNGRNHLLQLRLWLCEQEKVMVETLLLIMGIVATVMASSIGMKRPRCCGQNNCPNRIRCDDKHFSRSEIDANGS